MILTVEELIKKLSSCDPKSVVVGYNSLWGLLYPMNDKHIEERIVQECEEEDFEGKDRLKEGTKYVTVY